MKISNKTNFFSLIRLIKYPLKTKKALFLEKINTHTFIVDKKLDKNTIKRLFLEIFKIEVKKIRSLIISKKSNCKKIYIIFKSSEDLYTILNKICQ